MIRPIAIVLACALSTDGLAQVSPYTGSAVVPPDSSGSYRLLIGGHFHGSSSNRSGFPAATLLASIDTINAIGANVLLSTGDLFLEPDRDSARYAGSLFSKLRVALFNAPGNHDKEGTAYGSIAYPQLIRMGADRILILDTERDDSDIEGEQLEVLRSLADSMSAAQGGRVFIISHRPVWAEGDERYGPLFEGNTRSVAGNDFQDAVLPLLRRMAGSCEVFWISGSMAGRAPSSVFFQPHEKNITYIQSAIRDELRDALLIADVDRAHVHWSLISLTGSDVLPVHEQDADWWRSKQGGSEEFNWRLTPYLVKKNLSYPSFWYGALSAVLLALLWGWMRRRSDRSK